MLSFSSTLIKYLFHSDKFDSYSHLLLTSLSIYNNFWLRESIILKPNYDKHITRIPSNLMCFNVLFGPKELVHLTVIFRNKDALFSANQIRNQKKFLFFSACCRFCFPAPASAVTCFPAPASVTCFPAPASVTCFRACCCLHVFPRLRELQVFPR